MLQINHLTGTRAPAPRFRPLASACPSGTPMSVTSKAAVRAAGASAWFDATGPIGVEHTPASRPRGAPV